MLNRTFRYLLLFQVEKNVIFYIFQEIPLLPKYASDDEGYLNSDAFTYYRRMNINPHTINWLSSAYDTWSTHLKDAPSSEWLEIIMNFFSN